MFDEEEYDFTGIPESAEVIDQRVRDLGVYLREVHPQLFEMEDRKRFDELHPPLPLSTILSQFADEFEDTTHGLLMCTYIARQIVETVEPMYTVWLKEEAGALEFFSGDPDEDDGEEDEVSSMILSGMFYDSYIYWPDFFSFSLSAVGLEDTMEAAALTFSMILEFIFRQSESVRMTHIIRTMEIFDNKFIKFEAVLLLLFIVAHVRVFTEKVIPRFVYSEDV